MITLTGVSKSYGERAVLCDVSVTVPDGGRLVVVGPNGSGKTTLLRLVLGLERPDAGEVVAAGRPRVVFQEDRLAGHLSAVSNVRLVTGRAVPAASVLAELARVGLPVEEAAKPVAQLSGGQRRRVAIVRAMLAGGDLVCLDEPFAGIDEQGRESVISYVLDGVRQATVLLVTHDRDEAARFGGRLLDLGL